MPDVFQTNLLYRILEVCIYIAFEILHVRTWCLLSLLLHMWYDVYNIQEFGLLNILQSIDIWRVWCRMVVMVVMSPPFPREQQTATWTCTSM